MSLDSSFFSRAIAFVNDRYATQLPLLVCCFRCSSCPGIQVQAREKEGKTRQALTGLLSTIIDCREKALVFQKR